MHTNSIECGDTMIQNESIKHAISMSAKDDSHLFKYPGNIRGIKAFSLS